MSFQVKIIDDIAAEPVTLAEVKSFLRIDADYSSEDTVLDLIITSAREKLEAQLNLAFGVKTLEVQFTGYGIELPYGPTGDIASIYKLKDDGTQEPDPLTADDYRIEGLEYKTLLIGNPDRVTWFYPIAGGAYPETYNNFHASTYNVIYDTGFTELPKGLKHALLIQIQEDYKLQGMESGISDAALKMAEKYSRNLVLR